eukprot:352239-Chlamydomonas_euryale.AAC.17
MKIACQGRFLIAHSKFSCGRWPRGTTEVKTGSQKYYKDFPGTCIFANRGCHEEGSCGCTTFRDFLKLPGHTTLIPWPEIRTAAAERCLGQAGLAGRY